MTEPITLYARFVVTPEGATLNPQAEAESAIGGAIGRLVGTSIEFSGHRHVDVIAAGLVNEPGPEIPVYDPTSFAFMLDYAEREAAHYLRRYDEDIQFATTAEGRRNADWFRKESFKWENNALFLRSVRDLTVPQT